MLLLMMRRRRCALLRVGVLQGVWEVLLLWVGEVGWLWA